MKYTSIFTLTLLAAVPALAFDIVWVSHSGMDVFGCGSTTANPCRTFQYAYTNSVTGGGIIRAMDAGEYGSIHIGVPSPSTALALRSSRGIVPFRPCSCPAPRARSRFETSPSISLLAPAVPGLSRKAAT